MRIVYVMCNVKIKNPCKLLIYKGIVLTLAERARFELAVEFNPYVGLANRCLQPLGHLSIKEPASVESKVESRLQK